MRFKFKLLFVLVAFSCKQELEVDTFNTVPVNSEKQIVSETLNIVPDSLLMFPVKIMIHKDHLIITDPEARNAFHVVNLEENAYRGSFGTRGSGPGEILSAWDISSSEDGFLEVFDLLQKKIVEFNLDSLLLTGKFQKEHKLPSGISSYPKAIKGQKTYSLQGFGNDHIIYEIDQQTQTVKGFGKPIQLENATDEAIKERMYMGSMHTKENLFAIAYMFVPRIEIFNLQTTSWISIDGPQMFKPKFTYKKNANGSRSLSFGKNLKTAFSAIRITDTYIYALYNGNNIGGLKEEHANVIYVFDLKGRIVRKLILDKEIVSFAVYKDAFIYGVNVVMEPKILKFEI